MNAFIVHAVLLIIILSSLYNVVNCTSNLYVSHIKRVSSVQFQPPIIEHYLLTVTTGSIMRCVAACNKHDLCRTCDYDTLTKQCRLFESLGSTGTLLPSAMTSSVFILNYCLEKPVNYVVSAVYSEPDYICTPALPTKSLTVNQAFQQLALANNSVPLSMAERIAYMSSYGFYTSSNGGNSIPHYGYDGSLIKTNTYTNSLSCINYTPTTSTFIVCPYTIPRLDTLSFNLDTGYTMTLQNISTVGNPYYSYYDTNRIYISYRSSASALTIHSLNGTRILTADSQSMGIYTPFTLWQSQIVLGSAQSIYLFNLDGIYQSTWSFNFSSSLSAIGFIQHDYAGRRYIADSNPFPNTRGVYIYSQNSTFYTALYCTCTWSCAIKVSKRNITLVSLKSPNSLLYYYNF